MGLWRSSRAAPTRSWGLPGVIAKASGRPRGSLNAWILVVRPPRERPMAGLMGPLVRPPPSGGP